MSIKDKINILNKQFQELGLDYKFDTREKMIVYVVIHEVGMDVGDEVWDTFSTKEEAEERAEKCLHSWRVERYCMRVGKV